MEVMAVTILITGFEPFGGDTVNPSWEAVELLPEGVGGHDIRKLRLPVVFGRCGERLMAEAERLRPDVAIACGVAGGRAEVTPELVAVNWRMAALADNAGARYDGQPIAPEGADAFMTRLPVNDMVRAMREAGLPARLSLSAGAYVCNDLYYALMAAQERMGYRGLFIHVPLLSVLPAGETARAIACCLRCL